MDGKLYFKKELKGILRAYVFLVCFGIHQVV